MGGTTGKKTLAPKASSRSTELFFTPIRKQSNATTEKLSQMWTLYYSVPRQSLYCSCSNKMHSQCTYWMQLVRFQRGGGLPLGPGEEGTPQPSALWAPCLGIPSASWSWDCEMAEGLLSKYFGNRIYNFFFFLSVWAAQISLLKMGALTAAVLTVLPKVLRSTLLTAFPLWTSSYDGLWQTGVDASSEVSQKAV